jgi:hypothetical protein
MSTLRVNNITDNSGGTNNLNVPGTARAWVNFNGTGTVAIRANFNVSSITDNGTGDYTVNFTNAMTDANYAFVGSCEYVQASGDSPGLRIIGPFLTTSARFDIYGGGSLRDSSQVHVSVFR